MSSTPVEARPNAEEVSDRLALADLVACLALATDAGDWAAFVGCFAPGAGVDYGSLGAGPVEDIVQRLQESQAQYLGTMNVVGTHRVTLEGDRALAETYVVSHHFRQEGDSSWDDEAGTQYHDEFVRTAEGWRIARRVAEVRWFKSDPCAGGWL